MAIVDVRAPAVDVVPCAGDTGRMAPVLSWILVALVGAAVVMVVASLAGGGSGGPRQFLADLRGGLHRDGRSGMFSDVRRDHAETADVETGSVEDVFLVGEVDDHDYLRPPEFVDRVHRGRTRDHSHH